MGLEACENNYAKKCVCLEAWEQECATKHVGHEYAMKYMGLEAC